MVVEPTEETRLKESKPHPAAARFAQFKAALVADVTRTADERAKRDRERTDDTGYHRRAEGLS